MTDEDWAERLVAYRAQNRSEAEIAGIATHLEQRGPRQPRTHGEGIARSHQIGMVTRANYVPKEDELRFMTRDERGLPTLRLVDANDRLAIWSPLDGGALINPQGPGLRSMGLYSSYARGSDFYRPVYRSADLTMGRWVDLVREANNPYDANAVGMSAPGTGGTVFGYVQRGRAPAVARRLDAGEDLAGVSMRGVGPGEIDESSFILVGNRADLAAMLDA